MSFTATSQLLQQELLNAGVGNDYSYKVPGLQDSQYDFEHVSTKPPASAYMQKTGQTGAAGGGRMSAAPMTRSGFGTRNVETAARPMTSNRAAGYSAVPKTGKAGPFDPMNLGDSQKGLAKPLETKLELSPEEKLRAMEKEIHRLVEESAIVRAQGNPQVALERAKDAGKKERQLCRIREQQDMMDQLNVDLTYAVCLNLAIQHQANDNDNEAMTIYQQIVKNKQYPFSGRFRVNMGNIYFKQEKWTSAIKMYRMALDQLPPNVQEIRLKIVRNIGHAFFKMHQFSDAIDSYENLLLHGGQHLDFATGFNLILCYYALGNKDKMKSGFLKLLNVEQVGLEDFDDDDDLDLSASPQKVDDSAKKLCEGDDLLRQDIKKRQREAARLIVQAANLISQHIDQTAELGFDWIIDCLNQNGFPRIGSELEIAKSSYFLRNKRFDDAITVLKKFEKKDPSLLACAATNLSFLYFLEADYTSADKYADMAIKSDRYNARALVNKGNCMFMSDEFDRAKEVFLEAIGVSADCLEAIYNLGICNMHMGCFQEAMLAFEKLHSITDMNCEVLWQLGDIHEKLGNPQKAQECFSLLATNPRGRPTDPTVLARLAGLFDQMGDEAQAFHYQIESYQCYPVDMNVITWLGIYYVKQEMYESAIPFFDRAAQIQPAEVKWRLMVASCYRRMGSYQQALKLYEEIHKSHPNDIECIRYLIAICKESNQKYDHYAQKLSRLEKQQELQEQDSANSMNYMPRPAGTVSGIGEGIHMPKYGGGGGFVGGLPGRDDDDDLDLTQGPPRAQELFEADDTGMPMPGKGAPKRRLPMKHESPGFDDDDDDMDLPGIM